MRPNASRLTASVFRTSWGWMGMAASAHGVQALVLPEPSRKAVERALGEKLVSSCGRPMPRPSDFTRRPVQVLREARTQLMGFLGGRRRELDFPVDLSCGSPFQRRVWRTIQRIPYGRVRSYKWVAARVGGKGYARAVGLALGANPVPIAVPCHRVISSDSSLGGFSCGLSMKRRLLALEGTLKQLKMKNSK